MRIVTALPFLVVIAVLSSGAGLLYATLTNSPSVIAGTIYGFCIGMSVTCVERGLVLGGLQDRIRRLPTLVYILACETGSIVLVCFGFAVGGLINWSTGLTHDSLAVSTVPSLQILIYALLVSAALVFVARVRDLLGREVFANLLIGRYYRPVEEQRVFLFLDLVGSTTYARQHGDLRAQDYLGAIFAAIAEPVRLHSGTIDDYIGDMALITWPDLRGKTNAACIRCVFAIFEKIDRDALAWQRRFGQVPAFRAALHGGAVVTAEVGIDRHKISYFGDVVNTTGRIETLSRQLDATTLISADLLRECGALPAGIHARSFGNHVLRGRDEHMEVFGLERSEAPRAAVSDARRWRGPISSAAARSWNLQLLRSMRALGRLSAISALDLFRR